jgi:hypothetical protein
MRPEVVGQLQKYDMGFNGTSGQGGTQQAIAQYRLFDFAPGHYIDFQLHSATIVSNRVRGPVTPQSTNATTQSTKATTPVDHRSK